MKDTLAKPRRWRWLAAAALILVGAYACGEGFGGLLISDSDEVEMGRSVDVEIEKEFAIVADNDPVAVWARDLVAPLQTASAAFRDPSDIGGYKVEVIADNDLINAFAAPGGYTYITTGLIMHAESCAEIAGVMGHELAHVTERHGVKNIEEAFAAEVITEWFLGEGMAGDVAVTVHQFLMATTYSQQHESESDDVGLQIAYNAGYNPFGLVDFFERLLALQDGSVQVPEFLSSHPATEDRIRDVSAKIQSLYGSAVVRGQTQTYSCIGTQMQLDGVKSAISAGVSIR